MISSYGRGTILLNNTIILPIGVVSPDLLFLKLAYDAKFCLHYHFRPNVCGID